MSERFRNSEKFSDICLGKERGSYDLEEYPDSYEIFWAFNKGIDTSMIDNRIRIVKKYSIKYLIALYSSKFIINNSRNIVSDSLFIKKKSQKYIQTWHGAFGLKKVEKDVQDNLSKQYVRQAQLDSRMCDLMISNSRNYSELIRQSFWYNGPILEKCIPRNDIFYNSTAIQEKNIKVRQMLGVTKECMIVLYAPTFRSDMKLHYYDINWKDLILHLRNKFGREVEILVRLHPNMSYIKEAERLTEYDHVHNITSYPDITDYLIASDIMISDYTSAMFDFVLLNKPCFIYAIDKEKYDRGFYISLDKLPFPIAETEKQLISNITDFNNNEYLRSLRTFKDVYWGIDEDGYGCKRLYKWIENHRIR